VPKVVKAQWKNEKTCMKKAANGEISDIASCSAEDAKGKLAKTFTANQKAADRYCQQLPDFGFAGVTDINAAGIAAQFALSESMLGDLMRNWDSLDTGKCRSQVHTALAKGLAKATKPFTKCKKRGLKNSIRTADQLAEQCFQALADSGYITKAGNKIAGTISNQKKCPVGIPLSVVFPGTCGQGQPSAVQQCVERSLFCRACRMLNAADGLDQDCDSIDDGQNNGSCGQ